MYVTVGINIFVGLLIDDIWSYNVSLGNWTFWGNSTSKFPSYVGQLGWPPARFGPASWTSGDGLLYLFAGALSKFSSL